MIRSLALALLSLLAFAGIDTARAQVCQVPWIFTNGSGGSFQPDANQINADYAALQKCLVPATTTSLGLVQPDGVTITVNGQGVISAGLSGDAVLNNSDLMAAKTSTYPNGVWRIAYSGATLAPTSPPLFYLPSPSPCSLNAGAGDGGFQVRSADGLCWIADFPAGQGVDPQQWGGLCTADDTAVWTLVDAAMGSGTWPSAVPKTAIVPGCTTRANNFQFSNIQRITGNEDQSVLSCPASGTEPGECWYYQGTGPFTLDNVTLACPTYVALGTFAAPAAGCGSPYIMLMRANNGAAQINNINIHNIKESGGVNPLYITNASDVNVEIDNCYAPFGFCLIVSDQLSDGVTTVANMVIHIKRCALSGQYCVSLPVNGPAVNYPAGSRMSVTIDQCLGAGYIASKACADITSNASLDQDVHITSIDSNSAVEVKHTAWTPYATPNAHKDTRLDIYSIRHHAAGSGDAFATGADILLPYESDVVGDPATGNAQYGNIDAKATCHFSPPPARLVRSISAGGIGV